MPLTNLYVYVNALNTLILFFYQDCLITNRLQLHLNCNKTNSSNQIVLSNEKVCLCCVSRTALWCTIFIFLWIIIRDAVNNILKDPIAAWMSSYKIRKKNHDSRIYFATHHNPFNKTSPINKVNTPKKI